MQNHDGISSKYHFWIRNVQNWPKALTSVMSGPVQEDKYLLQTRRNTFIFQILHLSFFMNKFYFVCKILCFIKQIYYF